MTVNQLDAKAKRLAQDFLHLELELLNIIIEIDKIKAFRKLGYPSLFQYVTEALKLSAAQASSFINVARKAIQVPELRDEVANGLSISKAHKMTSVLTRENSHQWFQVAKDKTVRQLEREVAIASPKTAFVECTRYLPLGMDIPEKVTVKTSIPRIGLSLGLDEKTLLDLRRIQDLLCQKKKRNLNLEETLQLMSTICLDKLDPVRKAQRQKMKGLLPQEEQKDSEEQESCWSESEGSSCESGSGSSLPNDSSFKSDGLQVSETRLHESERTPCGLERGSFESYESLYERENSSRELAIEPFASEEGLCGLKNSSRELEIVPSASEEGLCESKNGFRESEMSSHVSKECLGESENSSCELENSSRESENSSRESFNKTSLRESKLPQAFKRYKKRSPIPARIVHQVQLRDKGQCAHQDPSGKRCSQRRFLEIHHLRPVAKGGGNELTNLALLCSGHHKLCHVSH